MMQGQIIEGRGGLYTVRDAAGIDHVLRAKKKFRRQHMTPLVGDRVDFTPGEGDEHGWLEEILPRSSQCLRPPVANITLLVIVAAVAPAPDWLLIDKLLLGARMQGMRAVLVMNKCDLGEDAAQQAGGQIVGHNGRGGNGNDAVKQGKGNGADDGLDHQSLTQVLVAIQKNGDIHQEIQNTGDIVGAEVQPQIGL